MIELRGQNLPDSARTPLEWPCLGCRCMPAMVVSFLLGPLDFAAASGDISVQAPGVGCSNTLPPSSIGLLHFFLAAGAANLRVGW